jgi:hypothetical protein
MLKPIFVEHLFGTTPWANLYPDQDTLTKNLIAQADLSSSEDRAMMRKAFGNGKGRHELTLYNNKRQSLARIFRANLLPALGCEPLPEDPPPTFEQIGGRSEKMKKQLTGKHQ